MVAAWHVDRGNPGWEPGAREGLGCGDVIAFHHQNYLQESLRIVEVAQIREQMVHYGTLFEQGDHNGYFGQGASVTRRLYLKLSIALR